MELNISRTLVAGEASGELLVLNEPLSFWGGVDPSSGQIIDVRHPQHGQSLTGRILVMGHTRGSSGAGAVVSEIIRNGTGPAAFVLGQPDPLIVVGAVAAAELYGKSIPVVVGVVPPGQSGRPGESVILAAR